MQKLRYIVMFTCVDIIYQLTNAYLRITLLLYCQIYTNNCLNKIRFLQMVFCSGLINNSILQFLFKINHVQTI